MSPSRTVRRVVALAGASALLLSGCGSATPGTAMTVGDERVTVKEIDQIASALCASITDNAPPEQGDVPARDIRQQIVFRMSYLKVAQDLMERYDVTAGPEYVEAQRRVRQQFADAPEEERDEIARLFSISELLQQAVPEIGAQALSEDGVTEPSFQEAAARGDEILLQALSEIDLDPRYGMELEEGELTQVDTGLSVAVSDTAVEGQDPEPGPEYTESLAVSGRC